MGDHVAGEAVAAEAVSVPVAALLTFGSALHDDPWGVGLTEEMVRHCLATGDVLGPEPIGDHTTDPMLHAARIAWLCLEGWTDPIVFDAGVPSMGRAPIGWRILDGNHRLASAEIMEMDEVLVEIDGEVDAGLEELRTAITAEGLSP